MSLPGPTGPTWALELVILAVLVLPVGDVLRSLVAHYAGLFRDLGWLERGLLDLYLGGGGLYVLAVVPIHLFSITTVVLYLGGGVVLWSILLPGRLRRKSSTPDRVSSPAWGPGWLPGLLVLGATVVLFGIEVGVAQTAATGNSYDTSLPTDYVSLLLRNHQVPLSLAPIAPQLTSYPQGTTVWLGTAQLLYALPPARTALILTPLFLSLSPIAGYVVGLRLLRSPWAGVAIGLTFALLGSWTRVMVATSNDFVFAFPLVLWLIARLDLWQQPHPPGWADTVAYGAVLGYSAALNPVGADLLVPTLVVLGLVASWRRWVVLGGLVLRWLAAAAVALLFVLPTFWTIITGRGTLFASTGNVAVPPATSVGGITFAQFVGSVDPFLFGPHAIWLSPFVVLRFELVLLLVGGAAVLVLPGLFERLGSAGASFRRVMIALVAVAIVLLLLQVVAHDAGGSLAALADLTSAAEMSVDLFAVYTILAAIPIFLLLDLGAAGVRESPTPVPPATRRRPATALDRSGPQVVVVALAVVLLVPGVVVAAADLPPYLEGLYESYGRVTPGDFAMFDWARENLPTGARVLVALGSAAQFLPGYARVAILFPVQPIDRNTSYRTLESELTNGTLGPAGLAALSVLDVQYIAVTGNTTNLWPPFQPAPLLADPVMFLLVFQSEDAYVFQVRG